MILILHVVLSLIALQGLILNLVMVLFLKINLLRIQLFLEL